MKSSTIDKSKWTEADIARAEIVGEDVVAIEIASGEYIAKEIADAKANGHPVGKYDAELKKAYLEYPDGRRDYNFSRADVMGKDTAIAEAKADISIQKAIAATEARGNPVALYDAELKKAYLEYPDGRRDYDFAKNTKL